MKALWLTTTCTNVEPIIDSLKCERVIHQYDKFPDPVGKVRSVKPDIVIYNGTVGPGSPSQGEFLEIRKLAPIIMICFDGASHDWHPVLQSYIDNDVFHLIVNIDGNPNHPKSDKVLTRLCPIDPSPYANPPSIIERPIHAGFCGGAGSSFRSDFLSALGSQIYIRPRVETLETYGEYAKFLTSCRMVLNMAKTGPGDAYQIKARVIETGLAKACLLEEKGSPISNHFVPNVDYLEYDGIDSCRNLIWKMGTNPTILQTIADNLHDKIVKNFSADTFWADILRRCGIPTYKPSLLI